MTREGVHAVQLNIRGKNLEITETSRAMVAEKLSRLERYRDDLTEATVELSYEKAKSAQDRYHIDVSLLAEGSLLLRAEARGAELRTALDTLVDVAYRQAVKQKERLQQRSKVSAAKTAAAMIASEMDSARRIPSEPTSVVVTEVVPMKPLTLDEALQDLNSQERDWLLFLDAKTSQPAVLERQGDGSFILHLPTPV